MAETYTDAKGNVFPVDAYGRPQGYWQNNQFIYPQFGKNFAAAQPDVAPVQPVQPVQSVDVYRLPSSVQEQQREEDSVGGDPTKYTFDRGAAGIAGGSGNPALQGGGK